MTDSDSVRMYNGDCLDVMDTLPDHSVDMVLCDLPYGTTQNKWDSVIPLDRLWDQYRRLIRPGSAIVLFCQMPFLATLYASNPSWFRYEWIWQKKNATGFLNANRAPLKIHENILVFCEKGAPYHPQLTPYNKGRSGELSGTGTTNYGHFKTRRDFPNNYGAFNDGIPNSTPGFRFPNDILVFGTDPNKVHPTQKPVALCEYLIRTYTEPGAIVLDNTMGSGSIGVASVRTGRGFIGIEKDPDYYKIACDRVKSAEYTEKRTMSLDNFL